VGDAEMMRMMAMKRLNMVKVAIKIKRMKKNEA
jgi:hypothetical protein